MAIKLILRDSLDEMKFIFSNQTCKNYPNVTPFDWFRDPRISFKNQLKSMMIMRFMKVIRVVINECSSLPPELLPGLV